jgi:cytochrome c biogenesis protein CcmG/thiol:disulfide interchange protein DsbE
LLLSLLGACNASAKVGVQAGDVAPRWSDPVADGGTLASSQVRRDPVYLNFFASWCPPCNAEAPWIETLQRRYANQGLRVVGVDVEENAATAKRFSDKYHLTFPVLVDSGDLANIYRVNGLPVHVFIKRDGTISRIVVGEMSDAQIAAAVKAIL